MMMKKLITTLGFILAMMGPSIALAAKPTIDQPHVLGSCENPNSIPNTACIEYTINGFSYNKCSTVCLTYQDDSYACSFIHSTGTVVEPNGQGNGSMKFTCQATDTTKPHDFKIDCGNSTFLTGTSSSSFSDYCVYGPNDIGKTYNVTCYVDDMQMQNTTNPECIRGIKIGNPIPLNICGNGKLDIGEECDLWTYPNSPSNSQNIIDGRLDLNGAYSSDYDGEGYSCKYCSIYYNGNFVYKPTACLRVDSPISVMNNEYIPYWRSLDFDTDNVTLGGSESCHGYTDTEGKTLLNKDSMTCTFNVYNGFHPEGDSPIATFTENCYNDNGQPHNYEDIYRYFRETHQTVEQADGAAVNSVFGLTDENSVTEFGEYKLVLETVHYQYCHTGFHDWRRGDRYGPVCQVDFAVTRPYAMQISTFGAKPIGVLGHSGFLYNFYDMQGNQLLDKTDLGQIMNIGDAQYSNEENVQNEIAKFKDKYAKLAVQVSSFGNNIALSTVFGSNVKNVKKVPNQHIYFVEGDGNGPIVINQNAFRTKQISAYTIFVSGSNVVIEGNVLQYAMIITTEKMSFKDGGSNNNYSRCADGGQVVQGLYIAGKGFEKADEHLKNNINNNRHFLWCPWGGLHVKGALIGNGIDKIVEGKRSQLNSWFNVNNNPERERREKIIGGAAVLIEYNPSLWKTLPPGAEVFTESLEVYRK